MVVETTIDDEILAYEGLRARLESESTGKWVLIRNREVVSLFGSFDAAAEQAVKRFGRGPYLIRQIGAAPVSLPASVMYRSEDAPDAVRLQG